MPSGRTHAQQTIALTPLVTLAVTAKFGVAPGILAGLGCAAGLVLSPDLDQEQRTASESLVIAKAPLFGWLFLLYFYPYALIIPHRHPLSHWPVIGTLGRLLYVGWPLLFVGVPAWLCWPALGLGVSDTGHFIADTLSTKVKKTLS
jgi:uncharacterized metal-binding protein